MNKLQLGLRKASPTILTCLGAIGVVGTAVLSVQATPKAMVLIKAKKDEVKTDKLTPQELIEATWKCYIPPVLVGASTIACIIGIGVLDKRNQAALSSAYAMVNESYKQYRQAAKKVYGADADDKICAEMAKDAMMADGGWGYQIYNMDMDTESERVLCYDMFSKRHFNTTMAAVINAQYHINRNLQLHGYCTLNEYYEFLGINGIELGNEMGWNLQEIYESGEMWLDFDNRKTVLEDNLECVIISGYEPQQFGAELLEEIVGED